MNANTTDCGRTAYTCSYSGCATHVLSSHQPMTDTEAREIIVRTFGASGAAHILGERVAA